LITFKNEIYLGNCDNTDYSLWYLRNNQIISAINNKCLYAMNGIDSALINCTEAYDQVNHYKHFIINNDGNICVKNYKEPNKKYCLDATDKKFGPSLTEYSEWVVENLN